MSCGIRRIFHIHNVCLKDILIVRSFRSEKLLNKGGLMSEKSLCMLPPMGWNSWNTFTDKIDEKLIFETAEAMKKEGLLDAGYKYIVIDDCWSLKQRDADGRLVADPEKFPHGIKALSDALHEKGFKFGMYSCCGTRTCADYPGSFEHEFEDAKQFAEWGVDYLKYDNCFKPQHMQDETLYRRMHLALCASGRDIVFSACQWGTENVHDWIQTTGAHLFRSTGDINDSWNSIKDIALSQLDKQVFSGPGCHNDMDMLVVGMYGHGGNEYISAGGCSDDEYMTHFALWALMRSPLMIGCDVRNMSEAAKKILTNRSLIAINQDPDCNAPFTVNCTSNAPESIVIARFLTNGDIALGLFNMGDALAPIAVDFFDLGLPYRSGCELELFDCINEQAYGTRREMMIETCKAHACRIFRCKLKPVNA